jgi:hypothetical protein
VGSNVVEMRPESKNGLLIAAAQVTRALSEDISFLQYARRTRVLRTTMFNVFLFAVVVRDDH